MAYLASAQRPDNVVRGMEFEKRHPEIEIKSPKETPDGYWHASWREGKAPPGEGTLIHISMELGWLLDMLESRFDHQP